MSLRVPLAFALSFLLVVALGSPAAAQETYVWNYTGTNPTLSGSWTPAGPPGADDTAVFTTFDGTTYNLPSFPQNMSFGDVRYLGLRPFVDTVLVGNTNTLTVGTGASMTTAPFAVRGSIGGPSGGTLALNNLRVNVATGTTFTSGSYQQQVGAVELSGFSARYDLRNGSQLRLVDAAGTTNYDLTINGGAGLRVNSGTTLTNGFGVNTNPQGAIRFHGGGTLIVQGANDVASTFNLNQVVAASGHSGVSVFHGLDTSTSGTPSVQLNLGNTSLQSGIARDVLDTAGNLLGRGVGTIEFTFSADEIPGFTGSNARVFLAPGASGIAVQNGVITEGTSDSTNSPYVILTGSIPSRTGSLGRFAAFNATTGEVTAQQGTPRTETTLSLVASNENVVYRPSSATANATLSLSISPQTIVFEPQGSGQSVTLGNGVTLTTPGIIVERPTTGTSLFTFSLNGGTLAGPDTARRNIFVLGLSSTVFNVSSTFAAGGDIVKSGGGTLALTGTTPQMDFAGNIIINQGSLRAKIDGGTANFGTSNTLMLRGGVFEVDATGVGTSTFSRNLGTGAGQVNWTSGTNYADRGSGGFSVVGGNLDVNIGGAGQKLVWHGTADGNEFFIRSAQHLRFGSGQSNGVITLVNDLALDDGSAGHPFESRQIVTESITSIIPTSALRTRITGVISGSASTGLMKSGNAMLELTAANTYAGGTTVDAGALLVSNTSGSATGTGRVVVYGLLLGNGIIAPSSGNGVTIMPSPVSGANGLALYRDQYIGTPGHLTIGSAGVNNPVTVRAGAFTLFQLNGATFDPNGGSTSYGRLTVKGTGAITINGVLTVGLNNDYTPSESDVFGILDNQTDNPITGTFAGLADGATVNAVFLNNAPAGTFKISYFGNISGSGISITGGNDIVLYNFIPVPEPASVLALCAGAAGLVGLARRVRRRRAVPA